MNKREVYPKSLKFSSRSPFDSNPPPLIMTLIAPLFPPFSKFRQKFHHSLLTLRKAIQKGYKGDLLFLTKLRDRVSHTLQR